MNKKAPGFPGIPARWTSSAKTGVGTSITSESNVWFTLSHGILNEIYYPRIDQASTRDMEFLVSDGSNHFAEEKRDMVSQIKMVEQGIPGFKIINTAKNNLYQIHKTIITDPKRDVLLQHVRFEPLKGKFSDYHLYVLLAPHLGNHGSGNTGWVDDYKGFPVINAQRENLSLSLVCSIPWLKRSVGYVGVSDGWQDIFQHKQMQWEYSAAENGNIALTAEINLQECNGEFTIALGFGLTPAEASLQAIGSLRDGFNKLKKDYIRRWRNWQKKLLPDPEIPEAGNLYTISASVLKTHEEKCLPGGMIASLSIPWGFDKGDEDLGGYHLIWPRDLVETAGGLLSIGAFDDVVHILSFLQNTQESDGHWPQNMWMDGMPYWHGVQMDETAFPILLVDLAYRKGALNETQLKRFFPMVKSAALFLLQNGPVTPQDRWEEDPGYSPFTLAVEIAALLAAADMFEHANEKDKAQFIRETADVWNAHIEDWTYVSDTDLAKQVGVKGYYVRIAPLIDDHEKISDKDFIPIKNRPVGNSTVPAVQIVSPDALALVRFGLRAADDPKILDTLKVVDALLKLDTPVGPTWRRYNEDGYGEHKNGDPFDGSGIGRPWPLLTGERAHYEIAAGHPKTAREYLKAMAAFANIGGLIPEQVWDEKDLPERELFFGQASGSAMPLVWAHAEMLKLIRSIRDGEIYDLPFQTRQRYIKNTNSSNLEIWAFNHKIRSVKTGKMIRLFLPAPAKICWMINGDIQKQENTTIDQGLGNYCADFSTLDLKTNTQIQFRIRWLNPRDREDEEFTISVI